MTTSPESYVWKTYVSPYLLSRKSLAVFLVVFTYVDHILAPEVGDSDATVLGDLPKLIAVIIYLRGYQTLACFRLLGLSFRVLSGAFAGSHIDSIDL